MKYKCLILDHDDTVVDSTTTIHYPSYVSYMKMMDICPMSLKEFFLYNFYSKFKDYYTKELKLTKEQMDEEEVYWNDYVSKHVPHVYEGMSHLIWEFKNRGGIVCVVSHSLKNNILRDYKENGLPTPDMVFGFELPSAKRKPNTYPLEMIQQKFQLELKDMVVVDDLKPGKIMADKMGVDFIGALWAHEIPEIQDYMMQNCQHYFMRPIDLETYLFEE